MKKIILITGTRARVGLHLVKQFLALDYTVIAHYRTSSESLLSLDNPNLIKLQADFDDIDATLSFVEQVKQHTSYLSAIVHNASFYQATESNLHNALQQYQSFFNVHMRTPYILNTALKTLLQQSPTTHADIIHITDIYAQRPHPDYDIYCSTKAGLANLSISQAKQFAPKIKVNCIAPGPIAFQADHPDSYQQQVLTTTPLQKMGGVEPIFQAILSLINNEFITGTTLNVDGGRAISY